LIRVFIKFFASLAEILGTSEISLALDDKSSFQVLIEKLKKKYPGKFQNTIFEPNGIIKKSYKILLNNQSIELGSFDEILLQNKDIIAFLPPIGGG